MKKPRMTRCAVCDEWYEEYGERHLVHEHPEPQSGRLRDALISSGLSYAEWIQRTEEGMDWVRYMDSVKK